MLTCGRRMFRFSPMRVRVDSVADGSPASADLIAHHRPRSPPANLYLAEHPKLTFQKRSQIRAAKHFICNNQRTARGCFENICFLGTLWEKGTQDGKPFDYTLWFSDTYVRSPTGWRYVFGQASLPLAKTSQ